MIGSQADAAPSDEEHIMSLLVDSAPGGITIVRPSGRLDLLTAAQFKQDLSKIVGDGQSRLVIDLDGVAFIDSSGLGALIGGLKAARQAGGDLRIARANQQARVILQLTTLERVLKPYSTIEEALSGY
jgi:anti-sigma B factor antagonist